MSKKVVNGSTVFSMEGCVKEFLHDEKRSTVYEFVDFLVNIKVIKRNYVKYGERQSYIYTLTPFVSDVLEGHYYTKPSMVKGELLNGTLYFDEFAGKVLTRLFRLKGSCKTTAIMDKWFYNVLATTAMEFYVPTIKTVKYKKKTTTKKK